MKLNIHIGNVDIHIDTSRIDKNLKEAQKLLNEKIVADCDPLIPFQQGALRNSVIYPKGVYGGEIEYNTSYAHFQYVGYVRTDENGRVFVGKHEKKPILTNEPLHYHTPGTTDHFFEKAKEQHKEKWVRLVKETVGKE